MEGIYVFKNTMQLSKINPFENFPLYSVGNVGNVWGWVNQLLKAFLRRKQD